MDLGAGTDVVAVENATRRFGDVIAVDSVSLAMAPGTILGMIGPSGAGKTTLVRMLTGAVAPSDGTVRVLGEDPQRFRRATRERIGFMPQEFALYRDLTARENVDFVASLFGLLWRTRHRRTREALQAVDLWDARNRRASQLSGGMQRRLELACVLVHSPDLLLLDEPTAGIDPLLRAQVWDELHRTKDQGRTILVTTQYVGEAEACDRVALISGGRLIALATPDDLRRLAVGGETLDVETAAPFEVSALDGMALVRSVEPLGLHRVRVTVDDAATSLPDVVEAVRARGGEVTSAQEVRPSFDEVFAALVERDLAARASAAEAGADTGVAA